MTFNLTLKGNLQLDTLNLRLRSKFFPLICSLTNLIQDHHFYQHLSQTPGSPCFPPLLDSLILSITKSSWFSGTTVFWNQLTSHCLYSGYHHLPIFIRCPLQFILHMFTCYFFAAAAADAARTLLFNHISLLSTCLISCILQLHLRHHFIHFLNTQGLVRHSSSCTCASSKQTLRAPTAIVC